MKQLFIKLSTKDRIYLYLSCLLTCGFLSYSLLFPLYVKLDLLKKTPIPNTLKNELQTITLLLEKKHKTYEEQLQENLRLKQLHYKQKHAFINYLTEFQSQEVHKNFLKHLYNLSNAFSIEIEQFLQKESQAYENLQKTSFELYINASFDKSLLILRALEESAFIYELTHLQSSKNQTFCTLTLWSIL